MEGVQLELPFPPTKEALYRGLYGGVQTEFEREMLKAAVEAFSTGRAVMHWHGSRTGRLVGCHVDRAVMDGL